MRYLRLLSWVAGAAWAIEETKAQVILDVLLRRATGAPSADDTPWDDDAQEERVAARSAERRRSEPEGGIAIVPVMGVISPRVRDVEGVSTGGGMSAEGFAAAMRQLAGDTGVSGILMDINSPGGNVYGIPEAAEAVREARSAKPVWAVAHHQAASAAYWLASAAEQLVVTPSGEIGSIGVYSYHEDVSKALEMAGRKPTLIKAGPNKAEGHPAFPMGDEAAAHVQSRVDDYYAMFVRDVAKGRGVPVATVRDSFGGGRMFGAQEAVRLGMADRVGTLDDTVRRMQRAIGKQKSGGEASGGDDIRARRRRLALA
jgi:capsid assembly protease